MGWVPLFSGRGISRRLSAIAQVDDADEPLLQGYSWHLAANGGYAISTRPSLRMHRLILGLSSQDKVEVDHINRQVLDNRRCNLRVVTHAHNMQNTASRRGSTSKFRGVHRRGDKWRACVRHEGKNYYLGNFHSEQEAAKVVTDWRRLHLAYTVETA